MPRRLLTIKYDGSGYCGWQLQQNGRSVQAEMEFALHKVTGENIRVTGCSRTDAGVHANMFCLHFDSESTIPDEKFPLALNSKLPDTISVQQCRSVPENFHARYSCRAKNYVYKIYNSRLRDPFKYKYYLTVPRHIDEMRLNGACGAFVGTHDFKGFCSTGSSVKNTVRTVSECSALRQGDDVIISITADGFLYNMVRIIVGTLLEVECGKIPEESLPDIISSCERSRAGATVGPEGLYLNRVYYDI